MRKLLRIIFVTSMVATSLSLVGCGNDESSKVKSTSIESTTEIDTTSEEVITNEVESTKETTTIEETTTIVEETTTSKVEKETTTKAPEPTTQAQTEPQTTKPAVDNSSISKLKSLHIAYVPKEAYMELDYEASNEQGGFVFRPGENYRKMADYVDTDCGDGTKKNPYTMYEWTTRKYYGDRDEVTVGFYCYQKDIDDYHNGKGIIQAKTREMIEAYDYSSNGIYIKIGTYEGKDVYFQYFFLINTDEIMEL